jgi:sensor histidine kinase YesM
MNKRIQILIHVAVWLVMFLSPMMFINHGRGITSSQFLVMCTVPLSFIVVFYMNYLWLTPHHFTRGHHRFYIVVNAVVIVILGIWVHLWVTYMHTLYDPDFRETDHWLTIGFILRDIFNLTIAAAVATTIRLAMRWQKAETARKDAEAAQMDAELSNLRSQINPHFLLNTLNNIYALTAFDQSKAQDAIQELSKMLRYILYDCQEPMVPLKDEVSFLENYVNLMRLRLPETVEVTFQSSVVNPQMAVAPMVFISLVENAFKHGISPTEPSFVHIDIQADQQQITCDISNSNHPKTAADHSGHGIGLQQVQRRLELAYPKRYTWQRDVTDDGKVYHSRIAIYN